MRIEKGTLLHRITGVEELAVNSAHHQAVKALGPGVVIDARAPDGVIEGIEDPRHRFVLGVQWHPEQGTDPRLFTALVSAAYERAAAARGEYSAAAERATAESAVLAPMI